jgi:hypothetical protein
MIEGWGKKREGREKEVEESGKDTGGQQKGG